MIVSKWRDFCKAPVSSDLGWNVYLESLFSPVPCLIGGVGSTSEARGGNEVPTQFGRYGSSCALAPEVSFPLWQTASEGSSLSNLP